MFLCLFMKYMAAWQNICRSAWSQRVLFPPFSFPLKWRILMVTFSYQLGESILFSDRERMPLYFYDVKGWLRKNTGKNRLPAGSLPVVFICTQKENSQRYLFIPTRRINSCAPNGNILLGLLVIYKAFLEEHVEERRPRAGFLCLFMIKKLYGKQTEKTFSPSWSPPLLFSCSRNSN